MLKVFEVFGSALLDDWFMGATFIFAAMLCLAATIAGKGRIGKSEIAIGMTLEDAYHITPEMITDALGGLPEHKFHCSVLGDKALRAAIDDYLERNGIENNLKSSTAKVICECKGVTDQMIEDLVKNDKVRNFDELQEATGCCTACGKCRSRIMDELNEFLHIYGK